MKLLLISLILMTFSIVHGQKDSIQRNKYRFFLEASPFLILDDPPGKKKTVVSPYSTYTTNSMSFGGGATIRAGNNWYLKKGRFNGVCRLTWLRLGLLTYDGLGLIVAPAHIGIGPRFLINEKISIEPTVSGGFLMIVNDILSPSAEYTYYVAPEIRVNINTFTIGAEYSFRTQRYSNGNIQGYVHYIGFTIGGRLKRID